MDTHRPVLLVGSLGLADAETAFRTLGKTVAGLARRFPDGECGPRSNWVHWQFGMVAADPQFVIAKSTERTSGGLTRAFDEYTLADGVDSKSFEFPLLGYADEAKSSYDTFRRLREAGEIPPGTRFQVSLPTPVAVVSVIFTREAQAAIEPSYERAMTREVEAIVGAIPSEDLAIQWDVCQEVLAAAGAWSVFYDDLMGDALTRLGRLGALAPAGAELGFHLCYGDPGHKHIKEPDNLGICVAFANGLADFVKRPINWIHMPVPRDRDDDAYFAPLADLRLKPACELYLGLIHMTDGVDGAKRRLAAAEKVVKGFGVGTECGFGRRPRETIPSLLRLHGDVARL